VTRLPVIGDLFNWIPPDSGDPYKGTYIVWLLLDIQPRQSKLSAALNVSYEDVTLCILDIQTNTKATISLPMEEILQCYKVIQEAA
jgi:hypothetical protein